MAQYTAVRLTVINWNLHLKKISVVTKFSSAADLEKNFSFALSKLEYVETHLLDVFRCSGAQIGRVCWQTPAESANQSCLKPSRKYCSYHYSIFFGHCYSGAHSVSDSTKWCGEDWMSKDLESSVRTWHITPCLESSISACGIIPRNDGFETLKISLQTLLRASSSPPKGQLVAERLLSDWSTKISKAVASQVNYE